MNFYDKEIQILQSGDKWTTEKVIDELHYYLESFRDKDNNTKYEKQTIDLRYRIPVYHPVPSFIINEGDLTDRLRKELTSYDACSREEILKAAVGRIFQNINDRYYFKSVKRLLKVEIVD
jgi:hypothetical protein